MTGAGVTCRECGTAFDADRTPAAPGADTSRCPACGTPHDLDDVPTTADAPGSDAPDVAAEVDGEGPVIALEVHVHR